MPALSRAALLLAASLVAGAAAAEPFTSPAERAIRAAETVVKARPKEPAGHHALAMAFARRARETSDGADYERAQRALDRAAKIEGQSESSRFDAEKVQIWILLGRHEFAAARDRARALNQRVPDDVMVYGYLTDASVELGDYGAAEESAQWMLDLQAGNVPALTRAAYLRELFGDPEGAIELMAQSYERVPPTEVEDRAWILTQIGHLSLLQGKQADAERVLEQALALYPGYHYALAGLARVRYEQRRPDEALALLRRRYDAAPHPENLFELARALERAGHADEARRAFAKFEAKALAESQRADNANRELVFYYADHAHRPADALRIAEREIARRHDVFTRDAYAWALHRSGRSPEAREQLDKALAIGVREPDLIRHRDAIAAALDGVASAP